MAIMPSLDPRLGEIFEAIVDAYDAQPPEQREALWHVRAFGEVGFTPVSGCSARRFGAVTQKTPISQPADGGWSGSGHRTQTTSWAMPATPMTMMAARSTDWGRRWPTLAPT